MPKKGFVPCMVRLEDGFIRDLAPELAPKGGETVLDVGDDMVIPGLVDVHLHGAMGRDFSRSDTEPDAPDEIAAYEYKNGVTAICPTTMALPKEKLQAVLGQIGRYAEKQETQRCGGRSHVLGIHLEGPHLAAQKAGAQKKESLTAPNTELFREWDLASGNRIRLVTIAPELPGAEAWIREVSQKAIVSIGHTNADYETARSAFIAGASHITHLFNGMGAIHHREPGLIPAAVDLRKDPAYRADIKLVKEDGCTDEVTGCVHEIYAELICDLIHVHPAMVRMAYSLFPDHIVLISDSMEGTGMPDGTYELGGQEVQKEGPRAVLTDRTLAGSVSNLFDCFRGAVSIGIPLEQAILSVTYLPAKSIGMERTCGVIREGAYGDLLVINDELKLVKIIDGRW